MDCDYITGSWLFILVLFWLWVALWKNTKKKKQMTIQQIQQQIIDEFTVYNTWMERYAYLIACGKKLPELSPDYKQDIYRIYGCVSMVWFVPSRNNGKLVFRADADALIARGIIAVMIRCFSNQTPTDIIKADINFLTIIGLTENLTPSRNNGLLAMFKKIQWYAKNNIT